MEDPNLYITTVNNLSNTKLIDQDSVNISVFKLYLEDSFKLEDLKDGNEMGLISLKDLKAQFKNKNIDLGLFKSSEYLIKWEENLKKIAFTIYLEFVPEQEILEFKEELKKEFKDGNVIYISSKESTQKFKDESGENAIFLTNELIPAIIQIELENKKKNQDLIKNWLHQNKEKSIIKQIEHPTLSKITWILRIKS